MTVQLTDAEKRRAHREAFIASNSLILHHMVGNEFERVEQWDWQKKDNGGRYDHYLLIQVFHDESWSVSLKMDHEERVTELLKAVVKVMDGKAFIAK